MLLLLQLGSIQYYKLEPSNSEHNSGGGLRNRHSQPLDREFAYIGPKSNGQHFWFRFLMESHPVSYCWCPCKVSSAYVHIEPSSDQKTVFSALLHSKHSGDECTAWYPLEDPKCYLSCFYCMKRVHLVVN